MDGILGWNHNTSVSIVSHNKSFVPSSGLTMKRNDSDHENKVVKGLNMCHLTY